MITTVEAARILGVSVPTLRRRVKSGEIPSPPPNPNLKRPKVLLLNREDVLRLKSGPPSPANPGTPRQDAND